METIMDIDKLTYKDIKEILAAFGDMQKPVEPSHFFDIGEKYLIRTVTMIVIGKLEGVGSTELLLSSACWVAETDRFSASLKTGNLIEVEPFIDDIIVGRGSIIDMTRWAHELPNKQKP